MFVWNIFLADNFPDEVIVNFGQNQISTFDFEKSNIIVAYTTV